MIRALRAAAKAAVRSWIKLGRIVAVNGSNDYDVQIDGHVNSIGVAVPMSRIRSLSSSEHAVDDEVYVAYINANRPRDGAMWVILDAGIRTYAQIQQIVTTAWNTATGNAERQRSNIASSVPSTLTVDTGWSYNSLLSIKRMLAVGSSLFAVPNETVTYKIDTSSAGSVELDACALWVDSDHVYGYRSGYIKKLQHDGTVAWSTAWPTAPIGVFPSLPAAAPQTLAALSSESGILVVATHDSSSGAAAMVGYDTSSGEEVWKIYNDQVFPSDSLAQDRVADDSWMCYSSADDVVIVRYATRGQPIMRTVSYYAGGGSMASLVVRYAYAKTMHVRAFNVSDGTVAWTVTMPQTGIMSGPIGDGLGPYYYSFGGEQPAFVPSSDVSGSVVDADGAYRFCFGACTVSQPVVAYTQDYGDGNTAPVYSFEQTRRTYMAKVTSSGVTVTELSVITDWGHNFTVLNNRLAWARVLGYDPTGKVLMSYIPGAAAAPSGLAGYYTWTNNGGIVTGQPFAAIDSVIDGIINASRAWQNETTVTLPQVLQYGIRLAIGSDSNAVISIPTSTPTISLLETTTGDETATSTLATAYQTLLVHDGKIYASASADVDRYT